MAPFSTAALSIELIKGRITLSSPVTELPNGPISTVNPAFSAICTAALTCGPGDPSINGSTVNSAVITFT